MIAERHNVACRLIVKAISKGSLAGCLVHLDAGRKRLRKNGHARIMQFQIYAAL